MSDSTAHNINVPERVAEITNRSDVAGKLYDPVHTVLAWDNDFRKVIHEVETAMDIDKVSQGFLVGISIEKEVGTVSFYFFVVAAVTVWARKATKALELSYPLCCLDESTGQEDLHVCTEGRTLCLSATVLCDGTLPLG